MKARRCPSHAAYAGVVTAYFLLGFVLGAAVTAVVWLAWGGYATPVPEVDEPRDRLPPGAGEVLAVLESTSIVLDSSGVVVSCSPSAHAYGLVRRDALLHDGVKSLVRAVRNDGTIRQDILHLSRRGPDGVAADEQRMLSVRVAPLGARHVVVLIQDKTQEERVEHVRRDFIANISHELKTPVGGLSLLSEAVLDAREDPEAVRRFASRMQVEADRLARLVTDIVDLTRLQAPDPLDAPSRVDVGAAVQEAADSISVLAEGKCITVQTVVERGLEVVGDEDLLITAVRNLLTNAVHYSEPDTRVAIRAQRRDGHVIVVVADHGHGIPLAEQDRIFERFYRVDPARSRATGGTGLGLAIVKHVCAIHGGTVSVWSQEGRGSTFTITLPPAPPEGAATGPIHQSVSRPGGVSVHPTVPHHEGATYP